MTGLPPPSVAAAPRDEPAPPRRRGGGPPWYYHFVEQYAEFLVHLCYAALGIGVIGVLAYCASSKDCSVGMALVAIAVVVAATLSAVATCGFVLVVLDIGRKARRIAAHLRASVDETDTQSIV